MVNVEERVEYKVEKRSHTEYNRDNVVDSDWCKSNREHSITDPDKTLGQNTMRRRQRNGSINFFFYWIYIII